MKTIIGKATLNNIDCMKYMKSLPDNYFNLIVTSPPYNMRTRVRNGEYTTREKSDHFSKKYNNFDDALTIDEYFTFHSNAINEMLRLSKIIIYNIQIVTGSKEALFKIIGLFHKDIKDIAIWDKGHGQPSMHDGVLNKATELILILEPNAKAGRCFNTYNFERGTLSDIWRIQREQSEVEGHSASFPIKFAETAILNFSKINDKVFDPFMGTGTTGVASLNHNREFYGCELDKDYYEASIKRITQATAQERLFA